MDYSTSLQSAVIDGYTADSNVFTRYSKFYLDHYKVWLKALRAFNGGRKYLKDTLNRHPSENDDEFTERQNSAYNLNFIKYAVNAFGNYIFSKPPRRSNVEQGIVNDFDRQGKRIDDAMWDIFRYHNLCGVAWVLVDMPRVIGNDISIVDKSRAKVRPYCKVLSPLQVVDWSFDNLGALEWAIIQEDVVEKSNPFAPVTLVRKRTLYTKQYSQVFTQVLASGAATQVSDSTNVVAHERIPNALGVVPIIPYSDILFSMDFNTPEIEDILTIFDAILQGESELLTNILKQTYGQLVLPMSLQSLVSKVKAKLVSAGVDLRDSSTETLIQQQVSTVLSRTKAIYEDSTEIGIARYIQPTGAEINGIITHNNRLVGFVTQLFGLLIWGSTTQRESAESKQFDNKNLAAQLMRIASRLEELEVDIWKLFNAWDSTITIPRIEYSKDFDIHELNAVIQGLVELSNINAGDAYSAQVKKTALHILDNLHHVPDADYESITKQINNNDTSSPITFTAQADHLTEASGQTPDNIAPRKAYDKSSARVSKTDEVK